MHGALDEAAQSRQPAVEAHGLAVAVDQLQEAGEVGAVPLARHVALGEAHAAAGGDAFGRLAVAQQEHGLRAGPAPVKRRTPSGRWTSSRPQRSRLARSSTSPTPRSGSSLGSQA